MLLAYEFHAIHDAALLGENKQIEALLEKGVRIDARSPDLRQPIHIATRAGHLTTVALLLNRSASVNTHDRKGDRPMHVAAEKGHEAIMKFLCEKRAMVSSPNDLGDHPIHVAARRGHLDLVRALLSHKAKITARNIHGDYPLHAATWGGHKNVLELLLNSKAELSARNMRNEQPILAALARNHRDVVVCLLDRGALSDERELVAEVTQGPNNRDMVMFVWQLREASRAFNDAEQQYNDRNFRGALTLYHKAATMFKEQSVTFKAAIALNGAAKCELQLRLFKECLATTQDALELSPPAEVAVELKHALGMARGEVGGVAALPTKTEAWIHHVFTLIHDPLREHNKGQITKDDLAHSCRSNPVVSTFFGVTSKACQGDKGHLITDALFDELDRNRNNCVSWSEFRAFYVERSHEQGMHLTHLDVTKVCHLCGDAVAGTNFHGQELSYWCRHCDLLMTSRGLQSHNLEREPRWEVVLRWRRLFQTIMARAHVYSPNNYRQQLPPTKIKKTKKVVQKFPSLEVIIKSCRNLKNLDTTGASDPYCICEIPGEDSANPKYSFETKPCNDTSNPVWDHEHIIPEFNPEDSLEFYVWDSDEESPDLLGSLMLVPADFYPHGLEEERALEDESGEFDGSMILVSIRVMPIQEEEEESPTPVHPTEAPSIQSPSVLTPQPWWWSSGNPGTACLERQDAIQEAIGVRDKTRGVALNVGAQLNPKGELKRENEKLRSRVAELERMVNSGSSRNAFPFKSFQEFQNFQQIREPLARTYEPFSLRSPSSKNGAVGSVPRFQPIERDMSRNAIPPKIRSERWY